MKYFDKERNRTYYTGQRVILGKSEIGTVVAPPKQNITPATGAAD